jgi:NADH-quinone oxidoreductase subunit L
MSRLMALAFWGDDRWREALPRPGSGVQGTHGSVPHEAPPTMAFPLVVLAVLAFFGGALSLPWHPGWDPLRWLGPVFGTNLYSPVQSAGTKWALAIADAVVALAGLGVALPIWTRRSEHPALEPPALRRALYFDDAYDATLGRPSEALARFAAVVVENRVIDGAVNGTGRLARGVGGALRRLQTGFVRQYALGIVVGAVALLAWMMVRALS